MMFEVNGKYRNQYKKIVREINQKCINFNLNNIKSIDLKLLTNIVEMHNNKFNFLLENYFCSTSDAYNYIINNDEDLIIFKFIHYHFYTKKLEIPVLNSSVRYFLEYL